MSVSKKDVQERKVRADLDGATAELVIAQDAVPFIRLRIEHALRRSSGLDDLLNPVLDELKLIGQCHASAKSQIAIAISKLME